MKNRLALDIDGVLAGFYRAFAKYLNGKLGIDIDENAEPPEYNIDKWSDNIDPAQVKPIIQEWLANNGYRTLPIYDGAKQFVYKLMDKYDVFVVTARIGDFRMDLPQPTKDIIKQNTEDWFKAHGIPADNIFFEHNKADFCKAYGIPVLVEDKLSNVKDAANAGIKGVLIDRPYNRDSNGRNHPNIYVAYNYDEVLDILNKIL